MMTWRGTKPYEAMKADQKRILEDLQGFRCVAPNVYEKDGYPYKATATDYPGLTAGEARAIGIPIADSEADDQFNALVIQYGI